METPKVGEYYRMEWHDNGSPDSYIQKVVELTDSGVKLVDICNIVGNFTIIGVQSFAPYYRFFKHGYYTRTLDKKYNTPLWQVLNGDTNE